ncbi:hypothetical protein ACHAXH_007879, partial [Discostella pseudostelligera]
MIATPTEFPCGSAGAKKHIRLAFRNSTNDARTTITDFQLSNSLHCTFAKAFGTTPNIHHQLSSSSLSREKVEEDVEKSKKDEKSSIVADEELLDPSSALEFLSHLDISRHEVHTRIASALRSSIEDEIQRMPIFVPPSLDNGTSSNTASATNNPGEAGHRALLNLLKSAWLFRDVPELRPILISVLKRLGEATPVPVLRRLALKRNAVESLTSSTLASAATGAASAAALVSLKHAELVSQLGPHLQRLIWEADWDEKLELARKKGEYDDWGENEGEGGELTLEGKTILADLIRPLVEAYITDTTLVQQADFAFVGSLSERRFATKLRRTVAGNADSEVSEKAGDAANASSIGGGQKPPTRTGTNSEDTTSSSSAVVVTSIKEVVGNRPKLFGAVLDMLIAEHATKGGGIGYDKTQSASDKKKRLLEGTSTGSIVGGTTNLSCTLVADTLLSYGQLPRSYEVLEIMARILDTAVQLGFITDASISQIQGCLRSIFRPSQSEQTQVNAEGTKIKLSLKPVSKAPASMFPDLPADDSEYERKLIQRVVKKALAAMKANDPQGLFLDPVTDDVAPGYSSIIDTPMCIRTMEQKTMNYKNINEYVDDTMLMFSNCCKYNTGSAGQYFRLEAERQKKLWKEEILPAVRSKVKEDLSKRKKTLKNKPKPPPALAFAPGKAGSVDGNRKRACTDDTAISNLTAQDVKPLPPWKCKRRRTEIEIPNMQCLASMLLADPFVVRVLVDTIQKILKADVLKSKSLPSGRPLLPSIFQLLNIARISTQLCAFNGKQYYLPCSGIRKVLQDGEFCPSYESIRNRLPLVAKLLLDSELDQRMVTGGDLHAAALQGTVARHLVQIHEWGGDFSSLYDIRAVIECAFVYLIQPGSTNEQALQYQFPRFVAALDKVSEGNMLNERPFFMSMSHALLRYKSKLPHSIRDLVTACLIRWLKIEDTVARKTVLCSPLHECFMYLLTEWSVFGNILLSRDLLLGLSEEAVAASNGVAVGEKYNAFVDLWTNDDDCFSAVKKQYIRMLSNTPSSRALQW